MPSRRQAVLIFQAYLTLASQHVPNAFQSIENNAILALD